MKTARRFCCLLLMLTLLLSLPLTVSANSAEPPGLIILTRGLPEDAQVILKMSDGEMLQYSCERRSRLWETSFRVFYDWEQDPEEMILEVVSGGECFSCPMPEGIARRYNTLLTLDFQTQTLVMGQSALRTPLLISLRVTLTLILEGLVLLLFGFREKRSWQVFLVLNLVTQTVLNMAVNSAVFYGGYWGILYFAMEAAIFLSESILCGKLFKEHTTFRRVLFALSANAASLILGGAMLTYFPV